MPRPWHPALPPASPSPWGSIAQTLQPKDPKLGRPQALEYQMQQGMAEATRMDAYLAPALPSGGCTGPELHAEACVLRLLGEV